MARRSRRRGLGLFIGGVTANLSAITKNTNTEIGKLQNYMQCKGL